MRERRVVSLARKIEKTVERTVKKKWRKLHTATKVWMALALVVGIAIGVAAAVFVSKNDTFVLKGKTSYALDVSTEEGATFLYTEEGVTAICFGQDKSGTVKAETDLQKDSEGRYVIPLDKEGVYTITYTVDGLKFGENAPRGQIKRVRTFVVTTNEEDGRHE
jgi:hypothetical protein